jgi:hypothetical protein
MATDQPSLKLHLEPANAIEVTELTGALASLARQYQNFIVSQKLGNADSRLLISAVEPGSIDISLLPEIVTSAMLVSAPYIDKAEALYKFGVRLKGLLDHFSKRQPAPSGESITVKDCDDAINIAKPIANHGGSQTFNIINGGVTYNVLTASHQEALAIIEGAASEKSQLLLPNADTKQQVAMTWSRLDREEAKVKGIHSPDKGLIEEIDPAPKAVLFTDEMASIKKAMISDQDNPLQAVYFVDVQIVRVAGRVVAYRIVGYHGKDEFADLLGSSSPAAPLPPS